MTSLRFIPENRLRRRSQFLRIYEQGTRGHGRLAVIFCQRRDDDAPWRLGLTVTRKTGGAVVRNRLRRRVREFFRLRCGQLPPGWDFVVNVKPAGREATSAEIGADLARILRRLGFEGIEPPPPRVNNDDC